MSFYGLCCLITAPSSAAQQQEETSLEADEPDNNHEVKQKTKEEKKFVSADQPSLGPSAGAKDRERSHEGCLFCDKISIEYYSDKMYRVEGFNWIYIFFEFMCLCVYVCMWLSVYVFSPASI